MSTIADGHDPRRLRGANVFVLARPARARPAAPPPRAGRCSCRLGDPGGRGQPAHGRRRRRAVHAQPDRRVPGLRQQPQARAWSRCSRLSWSHNGDGSVWTFKLRPGVKFHNGAAMTADDVVYTFQQLSNPKNASNALSTFTGRADPVGRQEGRLDHGRVPSRGPERQLPVPGLVGQLQRDHRPQGHRFRQVAEQLHGHGSIQVRQLHPERGRHVRAQSGLLGTQAAARRRPRSSSTPASSR